MGLDEYLFGKTARYFRNKKLEAAERLARTVKLESVKPRLTILARAVTGLPVELYPAEKEGGYRNECFFLPVSCPLFPTEETNLQYYIFRTLYLCTQKQLNLNWTGTAERSAKESLNAAEENSPIVLEELFREFPATKELHDQLRALLEVSATEKTAPAYHWLYGKWMLNDMGAEPESAGKVNDRIKSANTVQPKTTLKAKAVESVKNIATDKKMQEDYVLTHNFEKVETAEEFDGVWRDFDGEDELENHQDALEELTMKYTVRVDDTAHSVYQSDFIGNGTASEVSDLQRESCLLYDEWDYRRRAYKRNFCSLYPAVLKERDAHYYEKTLREHASVLNGLRKMLSNMQNKRRQQRRQSQGNDFDIDAATDLYTDIHSGHTPSEKIYISNPKKETELSVMLLLDCSLSSDGYTDGNHIIDVEKQMAILFGELLHEYNVDFSVAGFYSKTRNYSSFIGLKGFDDKWEEARFRIGAAEPAGYTRMGTALRHAGNLLQSRTANNKWLILLSDGKPNDFDTYEGKYGIHDVRQALRELNHSRINTYAFAIEKTARYYLPQLFGTNQYRVLSSPAQMLTAMSGLFDKIRRGK